MNQTDNTVLFHKPARESADKPANDQAHEQPPETADSGEAQVSSQDLCTQIRRDLLWAISSADRWSASSAFEVGDQHRLHQWVDAVPDRALMTSDLPRLQQRRLGHYFEALWLFYLQHQPDWQLRLANQVVFDDAPNDKRTIGEIDFVLQHRDSRHLLHLEIAVKFYLAVQHRNHTYWVGPSLKDNLQRKLDHLAHHQLPLGRHADIVARLNKPPDEHLAIIKGRGFWPRSGSAQRVDDTTPNPHETDGLWLSLTDATEALRDQRLAVLDRREWLAGPDQPSWQPFCTELLSLLKERAPVQVWLAPTVATTAPPKAMFIVPDDWLAQAKQFIDQECAAGRPI
ncbi:DUF1853 family protein [Salinispirillum sp. LH 10-3-1]|uniref:DUF1853 family protein n=1 Tax=Salinispirillum sp. LH 10-3-1 TaxID=2952525 RepID=A0AB38YJE6_9GAMM